MVARQGPVPAGTLRLLQEQTGMAPEDILARWRPDRAAPREQLVALADALEQQERRLGESGRLVAAARTAAEREAARERLTHDLAGYRTLKRLVTGR